MIAAVHDLSPMTETAHLPDADADADACDLVVLGESLADLFPHGPVLGGAPFNVARNAAALGLAVGIVSRTGRDAIGSAIAADCRRFGLRTNGLQQDAALPSGSVTVEISGTSHRFTIGPAQAWDALDAAAAVATLRQAAPRLVCFGTLAQRHPTSRAAIRAALAATPATRVLDLNLRMAADDGLDHAALAAESLQLADVVKVNDDELDQLLLWTQLDAVPCWGSAEHEVAVARLMRQFRLRLLVVTRGPHGHAAYDAHAGRIVQAPAPTVTVQDTVGAGDAFTAVLLIGLARGWPLPRTLARAGAFASDVCTLHGAVSPELSFYARTRAAWAD